MTDYIYHTGTPHAGSVPHSGRYPWGSGENAYQHNNDFYSTYKRMKKEGLSESDICEKLNMSSTELRARVTSAKEQEEKKNIEKAVKLRNKGYSLQAIGNECGVSEGTVRYWLKKSVTPKKTKLTNQEAVIFLREQVEAKGMVDVGAGVEMEIGEFGISDVKLKSVLQELKDEGYNVFNIRAQQMTNPGKYTDVKVLAKPEFTKEYANSHKGEIETITQYDIGAIKAQEEHPGFERTKYGLYFPKSIDASRIQVRYAEDGGKEKDGIIELRRGVEDLSLGATNYAQVRIAVNGTHYMKGMAIYKDDMPPGVDVIFNTHYSKGKPLLDTKSEKKDQCVLKPLKKDRDNPFGAAIKSVEKGGQRFYTDENGKEHLSAINIVNSEGDWNKWNKTLSSQFLSKQPLKLIKRQLDLSYANKADEFSDICLLTNPTIKQKMLEDFADSCDAAAVHLKAAALPRQSSRVILQVDDLKENEIYAPGYKNGETVVLIRYPHAGTFEIPKLKVNNKNPTAKAQFGAITDAVCINSKTAVQLSGADFDGDSVTVIPISNGAAGINVRSTDYLEGLKSFDTSKYEIEDPNNPLYLVDSDHGFNKQAEMGKISNLITDMTLMGAKPEEVERAVKHSMVVIDAEKHHLDWRQSYIDNRIGKLKVEYQGGEKRGASTLISRASSDARVNQRKTDYSGTRTGNEGNVKNGINILTGEKVTYETGSSYHKAILAYEKDEKGRYIRDENGKKIPVYESYINSQGKEVKRQKIEGYQEKATIRQTKSTKMTETNDAFTLVSEANTPQEIEYATYANKLKALANQARKEMINTKPKEYNASAASYYSEEVKSLNSKLVISLKNAPRERQAQLSANAIYKIKLQDNPQMSDDEKKKIKSQTLAEQRVRLGAHRAPIDITDKEWEAIQAGAISPSKLKEIMQYADADKLKEYAMPRNRDILTPAKENRIDIMRSNGETIEDIAEAVGAPASTIATYLLKKQEGNS